LPRIRKKSEKPAQKNRPAEVPPSAEAAIGQAEADVRSVMEKYDRESNTRQYAGVPKLLVRYALVFFALYCVAISLLFNWETRVKRASFVGFLVLLIFLIYPLRRGGGRVNRIPWYDVLLGAAGGGAYFYFVFNCSAIVSQGVKLTTPQVVLGAVGVLVTLEACRRSVGIPIVVVSSAFIVYGLTQKSVALSVYNLFYTTEGVIGVPVRACSTFIVLFVIFGAFLEKTGISQFFIDLANAVAGASTGGPAKVAVISSALCGMVSGSSVGNTVTTGSVTIPMMKKNGYRPEFAGAVEAAASTGGQIMPPIMGAAAFLMVEYTGYDYAYIASRAVLPAMLYFAGIFMAVHVEARRTGLRGLPREGLPDFFKLMLSRGYLLLPLVTLVILIMKVTMSMAAVVATATAIAVSLPRKDTRINAAKFFDALESGARSTLTVGVACAVAGVIACVITTTGIGSKLITLVVSLSGGQAMVAMFLTMITCIVLGMGVPTTANYVIMATTCAPILIKIGVAPLAAHMFVFYFGIVADITPPVALAAYAGSAIAGSRPMRTALNATSLAIAAFIVPYVFGLNPALLFVGTTGAQAILIAITSLIGIYGVASGMKGYSVAPMPMPLRIASVAAGLALIHPGLATDAVGILGIAGITLFLKLRGDGAAERQDSGV
jgi:TRAP transporter 4TM/12TM fusion protein